jgi:NhaP-type Na+/H+ or K+/H+ antiporter
MVVGNRIMPDYLVVALSSLGSIAFGIVVGWVTYGTLRRTQRTGLTDITTVIGAVAGAAVTALFPVETGAFGAYCIGLAIGFFGYLKAATKPNAPDWMGERSAHSSGSRATEPLEGTAGGRM